jgi:cytochrome c1
MLQRDHRAGLRALAVTAIALLGLPGGCGEVALPPSDHVPPAQARRVAAGDPQAGRKVIAATGCGLCHVIPGIPGAHGVVGPPLAGFAQRQLLGGIVPNEPSTLVTWIRDAPSLAPQTGMPRLPLSQQEAASVAAFLYTLR